ncbi:MAG: F0F1 ATP synthase subunit A [Clostridiales bacterium]|nr:F0F1 ATP synthase subunit A [Clostridiales bacterium]
MKTDIVLVIVGVILAVAGYFLRSSAAKKISAEESPPKKLKRKKKLFTVMTVFGSWLTIVEALILIFGKEKKELEVEIFPPKMTLFGHSINSSIVISWMVMLVLIILAVLIRIFVIPKMTEHPKGIQNVLEIMVEFIEKYIHSQVKGIDGLGAYIFTIAVYMIACASVELFGLRAPTADISMTFGMALITFFLINYYGIKIRGVGGRIKSLASPSPLVFPIRIVCDMAVPVSMACRLFGNMLGGLIVMDLLYTALGSRAVGFPSLVGLYFNVFHPIIQAFIFVTLTLAFINEAVETAEE